MGPPALTAGEIINREPLSRYQVTTIVLCGFVLVLDGYGSLSMGYVTTPVAESTHIPVHSFGLILSASLIGLMVAAMGTGPIADRWGRKWPVILSALTFALFSILNGRATTYDEFFVFRFLTGLGLGGAMPNAVALASEYAPKRLLAIIVVLLFIGMPLGGLICGLVSSAVITGPGWPWVFYVGGIVPMVLAVVLIWALPESAQFLVERAGDRKRAEKILAKISPAFAAGQIALAEGGSAPRGAGAPVKHLFTEGRAWGTILLWIPNFMNLLLLYFINSWLPSLLKVSGMSVSDGVLATAFVSFGGMVACVVEGSLINALGAYFVLLADFLLSAVFVVAVALFTHPFGLALTVTFFLGFLVIGGQAALNAMSANFYPTAIRSTGVGWALGVGRLGSIVGPLLGGKLLAHGWAPRQIIISGSVCGIFGWLAIRMSKLVQRNATAYSREAGAGHP